MANSIKALEEFELKIDNARSKYKDNDLVIKNLVTEINQEASGVTATLNSDNTITLSNTTGNDIVILPYSFVV